MPPAQKLGAHTNSPLSCWRPLLEQRLTFTTDSDRQAPPLNTCGRHAVAAWRWVQQSHGQQQAEGALAPGIQRGVCNVFVLLWAAATCYAPPC